MTWECTPKIPQTPQKLLDPINELGSTAGYKGNAQKIKAFLYTNLETSGKIKTHLMQQQEKESTKE